MAKVLSFSRTFPSYHPRKGEETFFLEKIWACLADQLPDFELPKDFVDYDWHEYYNANPKLHTIRAGDRWKEGEYFSPRVWSGKPYASKQIEIAPTIEIKKIYPFELTNSEYILNGNVLDLKGLTELAKNDGLAPDDFELWFNKPFKGQVICWSNEINY